MLSIDCNTLVHWMSVICANCPLLMPSSHIQNIISRFYPCFAFHPARYGILNACVFIKALTDALRLIPAGSWFTYSIRERFSDSGLGAWFSLSLLCNPSASLHEILTPQTASGKKFPAFRQCCQFSNRQRIPTLVAGRLTKRDRPTRPGLFAW